MRKKNQNDDTQQNEIEFVPAPDDEYKKIHAATVRKFARAFKGLAAYDRGERKLRTR